MVSVFTDTVETRVNTVVDGAGDFRPAIARLDDGGYIIVWYGGNNGQAKNEIYAQRYDAGGNMVGVETRINTYTNHDQLEPAVTGLGDGGYIVTWTSDTQDSDGYGIYQQRYDATGTAVGSAGRVNTTVASAQANSVVKALNDGGYVVAWDGWTQDTIGADPGVYMQRYSATGHKVGVETRVNTTTSGFQDNADIVVLHDGSFVVTWQGDQPGAHGIFSQRYTSSGVAVGGETRVDLATDNSSGMPATTVLNDGSYIVTWQGINGTGNSLNNYIFGGAGANVLDGGYGNDTLDGGTGADTMIGGKGDDVFWVDNSGDVVSEMVGGGTDIVVSYVSYSLSGLQVENLNLQGTDDINATGNSLANYMTGNDGNNRLNGGYGADLLQGGLGADTFVFSTASGADTIADFSAGEGDSIDVHAYTHGVVQSGFITQSGGDVVISLGGSNVITVWNAAVGDVNAHMVW